MMPPDIFELTTIERSDPLWRKIKEHLETRIKELRERNDSLDLGDRETLKIRTEIALYKSLLKL